MEVKTLNTLHLAFCVAIILFGIVTYILVGQQAYFSTQLGRVSPYYLLLPLIGLIAITVATSMFSKAVAKAKEATTFATKIGIFKKAFIFRCALVEFSALLNIVGFLLSNNLIFLAFGGISLLSLLSYRLNKAGLIADLQLVDSDAEKL